jgi:hypothetical protein
MSSAHLPVTSSAHHPATLSAHQPIALSRNRPSKSFANHPYTQPANPPYTSRAKCTYFYCAKGLLEKQSACQSNSNEVLTKKERDHILRAHSDTPVRIADTATGCIIIHKRNPELDMRFQCYCGSVMLLRDSVRTHHPCAQLSGVTVDNKYFLIVSSAREPADVQNETRSETEGDKDEQVDVSGNNSIVLWQAQTQPPHSFGASPNMASAEHSGYIIGALQFQRDLSQQQQLQLLEQKQLLRDHRRQHDELARQVQRLQEMVERVGQQNTGQQQQASPSTDFEKLQPPVIDPQFSAPDPCKLPDLQSSAFT